MTVQARVRKSSARNGQRTLFDLADENGRTINHQKRSAVTFKGGLSRPAHRWFRLTPSYSPDLVSSILAEFRSADSTVLDPFAGRGTTPIQCQLENVRAIGIEINPMLHFAARVSLNWNVDAKEVETATREILRWSREKQATLVNAPARVIADSLGVRFPAIHNVSRWWREDVLRDLLIIKAGIHKICVSRDLRDILLLAIGNILLDAANITLGRLQLHFVDRSGDTIDSFALFSRAAETVIEDLVVLNSQVTDNLAELRHGDSLQLASVLGQEQATLVITSPPYPNRYSYVWNTRPHLYFLDLFSTSREAGNLDCHTIGGTWGTATSRHMKRAFSYSDPAVERTIGTIVNEIREKDLLMSNYVAMYFDDLYRHVIQLRDHLRKGAVCAYVVGNSRIKKSIVETDLLLSRLFQEAGFRPVRLEQIRKRNSGKELHETIVISQYEG